MPYSITTKDGITIQDIPDDIPSDSQILKDRVAEIRARGQQQEAAPPTTSINEEVGPVEAGLISAGRGLTTIGRSLGLAEPEDPSVTRDFRALAEQRPISTTIGEIAGQTAPFLVPGTAIGAIGSTLGRAAAATGLGAAEAGLIARGEDRDAEAQLTSAGIGGVAAGTLELAVPVLGRIGGRIIRKIRGRAPAGAVIDASGNPSDELLQALQDSGQTFDDVVAEATEELQGRVLDPREVARQTFLEAQGLTPTRAQITRNAADFQAQQEAAKTSNRVRDALEAQEAVLTTRFDNAILESGGRADTASSTVVDALTEKATKLDQEISDLYGIARERLRPVAGAPESALTSQSVRMTGLASKLRELAPSNEATGGAIRAIVGDLQARGVLNENMRVVGRVGVDIAEEARKVMNNLFDPQNPFRNGLLRQFKDALDDDVFRAAGEDVFKQGRDAKAAFEAGLSRAKINKFDQRGANLVRDMLENKVDPDRVVDLVVFSKNWRPADLQQLKDYISTDEAGRKAFDDLRAETLQNIKDKSFIGAEDAQGITTLSRDKLQKSLARVGRGKMNVLFNPEEQKFLRDLLEVAKIREPVRATAQGRGPSAPAIGQLETRLKSLPVLANLLELISINAQGRVVLGGRPRSLVPDPQLPGAVAPAAVATAVAAQPEDEQ